ncbi:MAG: metallophosphoesterase family protein [Lachnospiraceae bacterium]|nr:metallophosphoesterase family protein [Lachnospiraceae bacterium]
MEERKIYKIGVISDTHGLLRDEVAEQLLDCDAILHAGDFDNIKVWERLNEIGMLYAVKGNNDYALGNRVPCSLRFTLYGITFFMVHDKKHIPTELKDADVVVFGHSHMYEAYHQENILFLNPGSCGKKRFCLPLTMVILEVAEDSGEIRVEKISLSEEENGKEAFMGSCLPVERDLKKLIRGVIKDMEKGKGTEAICKRRKIDKELAEQIQRIYVTHPGVDVDGILNRMEIAGL